MILRLALALVLVAPLPAEKPTLEEFLAAQTDPDVLSDVGQQAAAAGETAAAEKLWERAIELDPGHFPARFNLGYFHFQQKRFDAAAEHLRAAAELRPDDFNAHYLLGTVELERGRREEALESWRRALEIQPQNSKLIQVMIVEYGRGRYYEAAAELASRAVELSPYDLDVHLMAITAQRQAGDRAEGLKLAEQAYKRWNGSARAAFEYGWHLQKAGRFAEARPLLEKAMALDSDYEEPFYFYGDWLVEQGRYEEALEPLRRAIEIRPDYMPARTRLGRALMGLERWDEALAELRTAVEQEPRHPQPHLLLSQIYFRQGDRAKAREEKKISLRLRRENPALLEAVQGRPFP